MPPLPLHKQCVSPVSGYLELFLKCVVLKDANMGGAGGCEIRIGWYENDTAAAAVSTPVKTTSIAMLNMRLSTAATSIVASCATDAAANVYRHSAYAAYYCQCCCYFNCGSSTTSAATTSPAPLRTG